MATTERVPPYFHNNEAREVEMDSFAPPATGTSERSKLVIATFNIRYAVGSFLISGSLFRRLGLSLPRRRSRLVARHLHVAAQALSEGQLLPPADIVALQEADKRTVRAGGHHVARELAHELQMSYAHAAACIPRNEVPKAKQWYLDFEEHIPPADAGDTGIALLSRLPLLNVTRVDLPFAECAWRPRLALSASCLVSGQKIHIFNSHIDPHASIDEQLEQHTAVLARADEADGPCVLLGDFNTLTRRSGVAMRRLLESRGYVTPFLTGVATWRAGLVRLHTDWIFVRGVSITRWGVARPLGVSDHWPVWVEVELPVDRESQP